MITLQDLIAYAEAKKVPYECGTNFTDRYGERINYADTYFGMELKKDVWYWWECFTYRGEDPTYDMMFRQRYNRVNGHTIKAWNKGWEAQKIIETYLEKNNL